MHTQLEMTFERWKPVVGYENLYEVSDHGRVRRSAPGPSTRPGRIMHPCEFVNGYTKVRLYRNGKPTTYDVHGLVAAAFLGSRPEGYVVNHIDGDKHNNNVSNLEYVTVQQNVLHAVKRLGSRRKRHTYSRPGLSDEEVREIRRLASTGEYKQTQIAKMFNVKSTHICAIVNGKARTKEGRRRGPKPRIQAEREGD